VGRGVLVGEVGEPRAEVLGPGDCRCVVREAGGQLGERRGDRGGEGGRGAARGRRRALPQRREEVADRQVVQRDAASTPWRWNGTCSGDSGVLPRMRSAAFSATIITGA